MSSLSLSILWVIIAPGLPSSLIFNGAEVQFFQEHSLKHVNFFKVEDLSIITATASGNEGADGRACTAALMDTINGHHGYLTPRCLVPFLRPLCLLLT